VEHCTGVEALHCGALHRHHQSEERKGGRNHNVKTFS
jgi:hypothetical protein